MLIVKNATSITPKEKILLFAEEIEIFIDQSRTIPQDILKHKRYTQEEC